jgi:hypothetical protein
MKIKYNNQKKTNITMGVQVGYPHSQWKKVENPIKVEESL